MQNSTTLPYRAVGQIRQVDTCQALRTLPGTQTQSNNIRCYYSYHYNLGESDVPFDQWHVVFRVPLRLQGAVLRYC